jgi:membrane-associated phospholipid phosphatase
MILTDHYGWTVGLPAFAAAAYTAASRVAANRHWASDVVFGAFMGMASAQTVTWRVSETASVRPLAAPGGGGVLFVWSGR